MATAIADAARSAMDDGAPAPSLALPKLDVGKLAKRAATSWVAKYVALFIVVAISLAVIRPPFVLRDPPLAQRDNVAYRPACSPRAVLGFAAAAVMVAAVLPVALKHRKALASAVSWL